MADDTGKGKVFRAPDGLAARLWSAYHLYAAGLGRRVPLAELGQAVGDAERGKPYTASLMSEWLSGRKVPRYAALRAFAKVTGRPLSELVDEPEPESRAA